MLTRLTLRNFKRFKTAEIDLGKSVVLIGPNNSGKTTALQALALWEVGLRSWLAKRGGKASPEKRPGVAVNRRDLIAVPVPAANLLWRALHTRNVQTIEGKQRTRNIRVDVIVEGVTADRAWQCGFEFDYQNEESFVCRPIRQTGYEDVQVKDAKFSDVPEEANAVRVAYLPPMSGLADREFIKQPGEIGFLVGQGQTAQVLRNMCFQIYSREDKSSWEAVVRHVLDLFGVKLNPPEYIAERSEILMDYEEKGHDEGAVTLDLSSAGRGLQQTLLLLAHLYANPETVLLLDEPDAHLEILRQRQTFRLITEVAEQQGAQIIAASHSEVVLTEAAGRGKVIAFVGQPHTLNDRGNQVVKSLTDIGWEQYYQAEAAGWMIFVEGPTDLAILQAFAKTLEHPAAHLLERPFVHYVSTNLPHKARDLFYGLREAKPELVGIAIFDRINAELHEGTPLREMMWSRRELENYFCSENVLIGYARGERAYDLFERAESARRETAMRNAIREVASALETLGQPDPWSPDIKATDDFLDPLFRKFFKKLDLPISFRKADYHQLAKLLPASEIDEEIVLKLDAIVEVATRAKRDA
jgi:ABC-type lipoprotein export system ATPase subunit